MSQVPVIDAQALAKCYDTFWAVRALTFRVMPRQCWGLLGPNGAGKTTLLRMLTGTTPPSSGSLAVLGQPMPAQASTIRQRLGVVPQQDNLDPDFTVWENLTTYAEFFGLRPTDIGDHLRGLLAFATLENRANDAINTLSGGMRRRLSVARALVNSPELLILDEPTTGLDPQARQLIWQRLRALKHQGMTLILTTHYMEEAERLCDQVTVMDRGRILDSAPPRELIRRHIEPQVVEIHGQDLDDWHDHEGQHLARRWERVGETLFYYVHDEAPLLAAIHQRPDLHFLHRPANLEDVFVKLTGRELRDD